jgi:hypothetical protein
MAAKCISVGSPIIMIGDATDGECVTHSRLKVSRLHSVRKGAEMSTFVDVSLRADGFHLADIH